MKTEKCKHTNKKKHTKPNSKRKRTKTQGKNIGTEERIGYTIKKTECTEI
jgi:hypothetical protein